MFILHQHKISQTEQSYQNSLVMLTQNRSRMVGPYIPIWNRKPSRDESRKVVSWSKGARLPHIRIQLKDSKCVQKSIRKVLVPSKDLALIDSGKFFMYGP